MSERIFLLSEGREICFQIPLLTNPTNVGPIPFLDPWSVCSEVTKTWYVKFRPSRRLQPLPNTCLNMKLLV